MPLIQIDPHLPIKEMLDNVKKELALEAKAYWLDKDYSANSDTYMQIWKKHRKLFSHHLDSYFNKNNFLTLHYSETIGRITGKLKDILGLDFIFYHQSALLPDNVRINEINFYEKQNLTPDYRKLDKINTTLRLLTETIKTNIIEARKLYDNLKNIPCEPQWESDYELEIELAYILNHNDYLFVDDDYSDNIFYNHCEHLLHYKLTYFEEFYLNTPLPLNNELVKQISNPCYLFYILYNNLELTDISRIGDIWLDFRFINQKMIKI